MKMKDFIKNVLCFVAIQIIAYPASCTTVENRNITELHFIEQDLMTGLSNYINIMKENIVEYEDIAAQAKQDILNQVEYGRNDYLANPVSVFCLVKRFSEGWGKLAKFILEDDPTRGTKASCVCVFFIGSHGCFPHLAMHLNSHRSNP